MKEPGEKEEITNVLEISENEFIVVNEQETVEVWDLKKEEVRKEKLGFEIVGLTMEDRTEGRLLVTQTDRIERVRVAKL